MKEMLVGAVLKVADENKDDPVWEVVAETYSANYVARIIGNASSLTEALDWTYSQAEDEMYQDTWSKII
jgi:hypothetical protein